MTMGRGTAALALGAALVGAAAGMLLRRPRGPRVVQLRGLSRGRRDHAPKAAAQGAPQGRLEVHPSQYPSVRRDDGVEEVLHGVAVRDPYRWLEDPDSEETTAFVAAQNALTDGVLAQCGTREEFRALFRRLYDYPRYGTPFRKGPRYFYTLNSGLQAQSVVYSQASLDGEPSVLIDPNTLSEDGTVALMGWAFSESGALLAYSLSSGGSDWRSVRVMAIDAATGARSDLEDRLEHVKFSSLAWTHDEKGFFYNRYDPPAAGGGELGTETGANLRQQLAYHVLGRPQSEDVTVLTIPEHPEWMVGAEVTHCGRWLILSVSAGCEPTNRLWYVDLDALPRGPAGEGGAPGPLDLRRYAVGAPGAEALPIVKLVDSFAAQYEYVHNEGSVWTLQTNAAAPRYRLVTVDVAAPAAAADPSSWADLLPQHPRDLLQWASPLAGGLLAACYLADVKSKLELRSAADGALAREIALPGIGSVSGWSGSHRGTEFFFSFTSFTEPGATYRGDGAEAAAGAAPALFRRTATKGFSPDDFEARQVFVPSTDGTKVPMFVVHRRGLDLDGSHPTLLYGYGGFNISLEPSFSVARLCWMLAYGGVYAVANLRGGGEYGTEWRDAGSLGNKQNVFDDFQACAQYLHTAGYCSPATLAIQGGSNGGLLVAACANQRPDLFAVVLGQVGVMDMLRFHKFTIGHAWCTDYGNPDEEEGFRWVMPYSPVHNVTPPAAGAGQYPAVLLTTGDHDDRVVPLHSHKLTATLQHALAVGPGADASRQRNPLLTRVEVRAGHGAGKPTQKVIDEVTDMYAFAAGVIGAQWAYPGDLPAAGEGEAAGVAK